MPTGHDSSEPPSPDALPAPSRLRPRPDLQDPFETLAGATVETPAEWRARRAEIERLFHHYVYGYGPASPELTSSAERTGGVLDGAATLAETTIEFAVLSDDAPSITMATFLPADTDGSVPIFLAGTASATTAPSPIRR